MQAEEPSHSLQGAYTRLMAAHRGHITVDLKPGEQVCHPQKVLVLFGVVFPKKSNCGRYCFIFVCTTKKAP